MRPNARLRARITVIVCATLLGLAAAARPVVAGGEYLLDIKGTVEILGDASEPGDSKSGREVHYWVTFSTAIRPFRVPPSWIARRRSRTASSK